MGDLDKLSVPRLDEELTELLDRGRVCLIIDATDLDFCDSTGIWMLLATLRRAYERNGWLRLVGVHGFLGRLLELTRLREAFPIDPDLGQSVRMVSDQGISAFH
ncbi:anti-anti-sigma factor [Streptosporangium lutulentum]|uniref:Anti-sigma factor antagonist n=1 Tax=Streptosporangium lutulentum TaxID=1461250 RepID=A0ABT9QTA7_9ACTN|nr:anti-anti-sigma factor [Streptosporangium lutulentum]